MKKLTRTDRERGIKNATACSGTHFKQDKHGGWIGDICQRKVVTVMRFNDGRKRGYCKSCTEDNVPVRVDFVDGTRLALVDQDGFAL